MRKLLPLFMILFFFIFVTNTLQAKDKKIKEPSEETEFSKLMDEFKEGLNCDLELLTFGILQKKADSSQNPNNDFLQISSHLAELELRIHPRLSFKRLELSANPIMNLKWEKEVDKVDVWEDDLFINEWLSRIKVANSFFVSYGRENLQWGPSYICSPSNPFFRDNGRNNPKREVPGMDFGRILWIPNISWTFSLIANLDEGRQELNPFDFNEIYALKLDYAGNEAYASMILSYKEKAKAKTNLGFLGGITASDALLLYGEGSISKGTNAFYPKKDDSSPFGASMETSEDSSLQYIMLAGASYTLNIGSTLTMETLFNGPGYDSDEAEEYYLLRRKAAEAYTLPGPFKDLSRLTLSQTLDPGLRFLRRHYAMFQFRHNEIKNKLDLVLRWIQNMDDKSGQFISIAEYFLGDYIQLFLIGSINFGSKDTEFRSFLDHHFMFGIEYRF